MNLLNKKLMGTALSALMLVSVAGSAMAAPWNHRDHQQQYQINQGVRSGQLTHREAINLRRNEHHINQYERAARRDGHISTAEARRIHKMENRQSHKIYQEKHDGQRHW